MHEKTKKKYFQIDNEIKWFGVLGASQSYNFNVNWVFEDTIEIFIWNNFCVMAFKVEMKEGFVVNKGCWWKFITKGAIACNILEFASSVEKDSLII